MKAIRSIATVLFLLVSHVSQGAVFRVDFNDLDGARWVGRVDTVADTLTIDTWTENSDGIAFWTPAALPLVWAALDAELNPYDVPDNWGGTIGNDWAFVSSLDTVDMDWNEGSYAGVANLFPGWGGFIDGPAHLPPSIRVNFAYTQARVIGIPTAAVGTASPTADSLGVTVVPAPAAVWLLGSTLIALVGRRGHCKLRT